MTRSMFKWTQTDFPFCLRSQMRYSRICATFETSRELQTSPFQNDQVHMLFFSSDTEEVLSLSLSLSETLSLSLSLSIDICLYVKKYVDIFVTYICKYKVLGFDDSCIYISIFCKFVKSSSVIGKPRRR